MAGDERRANAAGNPLVPPRTKIHAAFDAGYAEYRRRRADADRDLKINAKAALLKARVLLSNGESRTPLSFMGLLKKKDGDDAE